MDALRAKVLLDRYLAGQATPEEIRLVETMYDRLIQEGEWQWKEGEKETLQALLEDRLLQKIDDQTAPIRSIPRFSKYIRRLVAAAVLIGISFGTYFFIKNQKAKQPTVAVVQAKPDVAPGGNRAVLTLSNGSKIILDSAHNGLLATQRGSNVIKTDSGKLAYNMPVGKPNNNNSTPSEISYNTLSTPRGGQYQLSLPDGTKVWLNAASSIVYPTAFIGNERKVTITGEAYFEVTHNPAKPFIVSVNDMKVEVLGTHFNVNAYMDEKSINTTLLEGSVKIADGINTQIIKPGQQIEVEGGQMNVNKNVDVDRVVAWKNGNFDFESADLRTILRQFSRWYDVDVIYEGEINNKKFFAIVSRNTSLKNMLESLQDFQLEYRIEGRKLYIKQN